MIIRQKCFMTSRCVKLSFTLYKCSYKCLPVLADSNEASPEDGFPLISWENAPIARLAPIFNMGTSSCFFLVWLSTCLAAGGHDCQIALHPRNRGHFEMYLIYNHQKLDCIYWCFVGGLGYGMLFHDYCRSFLTRTSGVTVYFKRWAGNIRFNWPIWWIAYCRPSFTQCAHRIGVILSFIFTPYGLVILL